jgi:hypothetical protein
MNKSIYDDINNIMNTLPSIISDNSDNSDNSKILQETFNQFKNAKNMIKICKEKNERGDPLTEGEEKAWVTIHIFLADIYTNNTNYGNYKDNGFLFKNFPRYYINNTNDDVLFEMFPQLYIDITSKLLIDIANTKK